MKNILFIILLLCINCIEAQENIAFNEKLANTLKADDYGMKVYVFCLLKTGSFLSPTEEERNKLFEGHMNNINRLAKEGKLVLAGPFMKNNREYRGIFIFNVSTIDEAYKLIETDPAVKANLFDPEMTLWYGSAALQQLDSIHKTIEKKKF